MHVNSIPKAVRRTCRITSRLVVGLYSGYLLATLCPANTPANQMQTGTLWLIYALIAMTSPIGLWLARGWVYRGLHQSRPTSAQIQARTE